MRNESRLELYKWLVASRLLLTNKCANENDRKRMALSAQNANTDCTLCGFQAVPPVVRII